MIIELESKRFTVAHQSVSHSSKTHSVDLEPEPQARLRNSLPRFKFMGESFKIGNHLGINIGHKPGHHSPKKNAAVARTWLAGKRSGTKCDPPCGRVRTRTEDLEFSQRHHRARVSPCLPKDPVGRSRGSIVCPHD